MNTGNIVRLVIDDARNNDPWPLMGLLDFIIRDKGYSEERVKLFATRRLHIPLPVVDIKLIEYGFTVIQ